MLPIDDLWAQFAYEPADARTEREMEALLTEMYPEAEWTVRFNDTGSGLTVTTKFKSPEEQTFYMLKWS